MFIILVTFGVMTIVVAVMAIGVILSNKPIKGSCGGLSALGMKESCMVCGGDETEWRREVALIGKPDLAYDAMAEKKSS
jgi:hypothetical protein